MERLGIYVSEAEKNPDDLTPYKKSDIQSLKEAQSVTWCMNHGLKNEYPRVRLLAATILLEWRFVPNDQEGVVLVCGRLEDEQCGPVKVMLARHIIDADYQRVGIRPQVIEMAEKIIELDQAKTANG